jgi:hypothetical protein
MLRRVLVSFLLIIALLTGAVYNGPYAYAFGPNGQINYSSGFISGQNAVFHFKIPFGWHGKVEIERVTPQQGAAVEILRFVCPSVSGRAGSAVMLVLYVYTHEQWRSVSPSQRQRGVVVKETDEFIAYAEYHQSNPFTFASDRERFDYVMGYVYERDDNAETRRKTSRLICFSGREPVNRVYVSNVLLPEEFLIIDRIRYVPLRAVVEALGYTVLWTEQTKTAEILMMGVRGQFADRFIVSGDMEFYRSETIAHRDHNDIIHMRLINGRTYVSLGYISSVLRKSVRVGEHISVLW